MKPKLLLLLIIFLVACTSQEYNKGDTVAVLDGREIKVEDILWLYSLEENTEERIVSYLKQTVLVQEAKNMGITLIEEEVEESKQAIFPGYTAIERFEENKNKEFYRKQASILGVSPEEYYEVWENTSYTAAGYMDQYINQVFGEPDSVEHAEWWNKMVNEHYDEVFERYKSEEILEIK